MLFKIMEIEMKLFKFVWPLLIALGFTAVAHADHPIIDQDASRFNIELNERDFDALRNFINTKRTIDVQEKAVNLTISGDVRTEWRHLDEKARGFRLRGHKRTDLGNELALGTAQNEPDIDYIILDEPVESVTFPGGIPISRNDFDIEFNLRFDYVCERAWAVAHLQFDNSAGVDDNDFSCLQDRRGYHGSGECDDLCLKRAYFGYNICCEGATRFDVEVGRRKLYDIFDSQIQFLSRFDGILLKYSSNWECVADWYWNVGGFVVDERVNHFAWVTELGFLNICDYGFDFKYSYIQWNKYGRNRCFVENPAGFRFKVSQFTMYYHLEPELICMPAKIYGAFLINHDGKRRFNRKRFNDQNLGWYVGFTVGEVVNEGDWSIDVQYQTIQAFAIPDDDVSGIGRGNCLGESITAINTASLARETILRGNTNFKGWRFEGLYALTDNLSLDTIIEFSRAYKKSIGGSHHYSKFELEAIYAF
jgi:hypothetical protein